MKIATILVRVLLGLLFLFASVTFFLKLIPTPELTGPIKTFNEGLRAAVYLLPLIKGIELLCGLAFVIGRYVPLAAVLIAPITVNIFLSHLFIAREAMPMAIFVLLANAFLLFAYRKNYQGLFAAK